MAENIQILIIIAIAAALYSMQNTSNIVVKAGKHAVVFNRVVAFFVPTIFLCLNGKSADRNEYVLKINNVFKYGYGASGKEYGFNVLVNGLMHIFNDIDLTLFAVGFISCIIYFVAIKRLSKWYSYNSLFLAYVSSIYFWGYVEVNSFLAISFGLLGISYLHENNIRNFIVCLGIGTMFHYSIIFLAIALLFRQNGGLKKMIILFGIIVGFFTVESFAPAILERIGFLNKYTFYLTYGLGFDYKSAFEFSGYVLYFVPLLVLSLYLLINNPTINEKEMDRKNNNMIAFGTIVLFLSSMFLRSIVFYRLEHIMYIFYILMIGKSEQIIKINYKKAIIAIYCLVLLYSFFGFGSVNVLPYKTFFAN